MKLNIFFIIRFLNTGFIKRINSSQLRSKIEDPLSPTVYSKGVVGVGKYAANKNGKHTKEGVLWYNMLMRCYSEAYHKVTPTYIGCTVCDRWLYFQNFCEDIKYLANYDKWVLDFSYWDLDKDSKVKNNKIYSPETCIFETSPQNTALYNISKHKYLAISPSNEKYEFTNMREFEEQHGMERRGVSAVVTFKQQTHHGWKFKKLL